MLTVVADYSYQDGLRARRRLSNTLLTAPDVQQLYAGPDQPVSTNRQTVFPVQFQRCGNAGVESVYSLHRGRNTAEMSDHYIAFSHVVVHRLCWV